MFAAARYLHLNLFNNVPIVIQFTSSLAYHRQRPSQGSVKALDRKDRGWPIFKKIQ